MLKERALQIWTNNEDNILEEVVEIALDTLIYQSLVRIDKGWNITMHDQLWDMNQNIVESELKYKGTRI